MKKITNHGKTVLVLATVLTLAIGVIMSPTMIVYQQPVSAQNVTNGGDNNNLTAGATENMTAGVGAEMDRTGSISSAGGGEEAGDPIPDIDVKLGPPCSKSPKK